MKEPMLVHYNENLPFICNAFWLGLLYFTSSHNVGELFSSILGLCSFEFSMRYTLELFAEIIMQ